MRLPQRWAVWLVALFMLAAVAPMTVATHVDDDGDDTNDDHKVLVCHLPPGNPENAHTLEIDENALDAHLDHGDHEGACEGDGDDVDDGDTNDDHKVLVCHVPPGNPENAHTIEIDENALDAHLDHGDHEGACEGDGDDVDDGDSGDNGDDGDTGDDRDQGPDCVGVTGIMASSSAGNVQVTWNAFAGADGYVVYREEAGGDREAIATLDANATIFTDLDVDIGTTYTYWVAALGDETQTDLCEQAEVTAIPVFPTAVAGVLASVVGLGAYGFLRRRP